MRLVDLPWLVIFDNAIDQKMINDWWPHGPAGAILITTMDPVFSSNNVAGYGAKLDELDSESCITMVLTQITEPAKGQNQQEAEREARKLTERLGNLPLAIQSAVGSINESARTLAHWNRRANTERILEPAHQFNFNYAPYHKGLLEAFSSRILSLKDSSKSLLDVLSTFDPDQIPEQLIDQESPAEDLGNISFVAELDDCILQLCKGVLLRGVRHATGDSSYGNMKDTSYFYMNRQLLDFVRIQMSDEDRQAAFEAASTLLSLAIGIRNYPQNDDSAHGSKSDATSNQEYVSMYLPHISSLRNFYQDCCDRNGKGALRVPIHFLKVLVRSSG